MQQRLVVTFKMGKQSGGPGAQVLWVETKKLNEGKRSRRSLLGSCLDVVVIDTSWLLSEALPGTVPAGVCEVHVDEASMRIMGRCGKSDAQLWSLKVGGERCLLMLCG